MSDSKQEELLGCLWIIIGLLAHPYSSLFSILALSMGGLGMLIAIVFAIKKNKVAQK